MSAKRKNLAYRGILFHVGKLYYDNGNLDIADKIFENAISFGEDVAAANYLRGMIATGRNNLPAAEKFFEEAAKAEPFTSVHYYNWADALRRNHQSKEASAIYERGATRATSDRERTVYRFKARISLIEAGQAAPVNEEVEAKQAAGPLPLDWLMTAAALRIQEGKIPDAVALIDKARTSDSGNLYTLFSSCANDLFFSSAAEKYPEIAKACGIQTKTELLFPGSR
jgi:tetratricopeptide (TPR) repeat protein